MKAIRTSGFSTLGRRHALNSLLLMIEDLHDFRYQNHGNSSMVVYSVVSLVIWDYIINNMSSCTGLRTCSAPWSLTVASQTVEAAELLKRLLVHIPYLDGNRFMVCVGHLALKVLRLGRYENWRC